MVGKFLLEISNIRLLRGFPKNLWKHILVCEYIYMQSMWEKGYVEMKKQFFFQWHSDNNIKIATPA